MVRHLAGIALVMGAGSVQAGCTAAAPTTTPEPPADNSPSEGASNRGTLEHHGVVGDARVLSVSHESPDAAPDEDAELGLYARLAPATVVITSHTGKGSGVLLDSDGWILTNAHVVEDGELLEDGRLELNVWVGEFDDNNGRMTMEDSARKAIVYKYDASRDLALLKLSGETPKRLAVTLATRAPVPGDAVSSIGHPSAGLLWSFKSGQISAIGDLDTRGMNVQIIQSTCAIMPGDSGGPLVNAAGELVGLNSFIHGGGGQWAYFHIHLDAVKDFLAERPSVAMTMEVPVIELPAHPVELGTWPPFTIAQSTTVPVPNRSKGLQAVMLISDNRMGVYFDLDGKLGGKRQDKRKPEELALAGEFRAELTLAVIVDLGYFWFYDINADGKTDLVTFVSHTHDPTTSPSERTWRSDESEALVHDETLTGIKALDSTVFSAALRDAAEIVVTELRN